MTNLIHVLAKGIGCGLLAIGIAAPLLAYSEELENGGEREGMLSQEAEREGSDEGRGLFSGGMGDREAGEHAERGGFSSGGRGEHGEVEEENGQHGTSAREYDEERGGGVGERFGGLFSGGREATE